MAQNTFQPGHPKLGGRRKGTPNTITREIREFARAVLEQPEAQEALKRQARRGALHPSTLAVMLYYAYGKPVDRVQQLPPPKPEKFDLNKLTVEEVREWRRLALKASVTEPSATGSAA